MRKALALFTALVSPPLSADLSSGIDPATGLRWWRWDGGDYSVYIAQRLPDQTRAFLLARGFPRPLADEVATACALQLEVRNLGRQEVRIDLARWRTVSGGHQRKLMLREHWTQRWRREPLPRAQQVALHWALYPTRQRFARGDYNWGIILLGWPPGERVDLHAQLEVDGKPVRLLVPGVECAPDVDHLRRP